MGHRHGGNPLNSGEAVAFYWPEIADPKVGGTIFTGLQHVWRTKDNGGNCIRRSRRTARD